MSKVSRDNGRLSIPGAAAIHRTWELEWQRNANIEWANQMPHVLGKAKKPETIQKRTDDFFKSFRIGELRSEAIHDLRKLIFGNARGESADLLLQAAQNTRDEVYRNVGNLAVVRFWTPNTRPSRLSATHSPTGNFGFMQDQLELTGVEHAHFVTRRSVVNTGFDDSTTAYDTELAIPLRVMAPAHLQSNNQVRSQNRRSRPVLNGKWIRIPLFSARPVPALGRTEIEVHNHFSQEMTAVDRSFRHSQAAVNYGHEAQDLLRDHQELPMPHYGNVPGDFQAAYRDLVQLVGEWLTPVAFSVPRQH